MRGSRWTSAGSHDTRLKQTRLVPGTGRWPERTAPPDAGAAGGTGRAEQTCPVPGTGRCPQGTGRRVKLIAYDGGKVGYVDGEEIVRLDVPTMREWFERGGADE